MTRIVLLGASGFIGKSLLPKLISEKFNVMPMIHNSSIKNSNIIHGDILNPGFLDSKLDEDDVVVNLIGQYTNNDSNFIDLNIKGGLNLLNSCMKKNVKRIILVSTINVYGNSIKKPSTENDELLPKTNYGLIKSLTEKLYEQFSKIYNLDITILRMSNLYGPNKKAGYISHLIHSAIDSEKNILAYNNGNQLRDVLYIDDAVDGIIKCIKTPISGYDIFNISSGSKYKINEIIGEIESISKQKLNIKYSEDIPDEVCIWADNTKAKKFFGFSPTISLQDGLKITINYLKDI